MLPLAVAFRWVGARRRIVAWAGALLSAYSWAGASAGALAFERRFDTAVESAAARAERIVAAVARTAVVAAHIGAVAGRIAAAAHIAAVARIAGEDLDFAADNIARSVVANTAAGSREPPAAVRLEPPGSSAAYREADGVPVDRDVWAGWLQPYVSSHHEDPSSKVSGCYLNRS